MTIMQAKVIQNMAKCDLNASETARSMYVHLHTMWYYIYKTIRETGLDPRKFYDLCELLPRANAVLEEQDGN